MKALLTTLLLAAAACTPAAAQSAANVGHIKYEVTRRIDPNSMRIMINGQQVKPGSPDFPADIPTSRTTSLTLSYANGYGKETEEGGAPMRMIMTAGGGAPQMTSMARPFEETVYLNLKDQQYTTLLSVKKDEQTTLYRNDAPFAKPSGWQLTDQTKKIAGYTCRKATVPYKKETYTVWYTTELPFTYSPIKDLVPEKGVVLAVEGSGEQVSVSKVDNKPVVESEVRPAANAQAQVVTPEQLKEAREKALADFRQRMMEETMNGRGAN